MKEVVLNAEVRTELGKSAKYARAKGKIPGVYYAHGEGNISIAVPTPDLETLVFSSATHIIELRLDNGQSKKCVIRDVQYDPISDRPIHFDLQGLKEDEKLTIDVPIVLTGGVPKGVRDGGMLQHFIHKLRISCLPKDIPQKIEIPVQEMSINDFVHVKDLPLANVTVLENAEAAIVGVMPPHVVKEAEVPAPGEELKEPEVVAKGKKLEEGEEGAEAPKKAEPPKKAEVPKKEEKK